jgi:hypothetical protein
MIIGAATEVQRNSGHPRWAATSRLSSTSTVNSPGLHPSSTFMSLSLGGEPAFLRGVAKHGAARQLLRR